MESIFVALISGGLALIGTVVSVFWANRKSTALITYRIDELEKKVHAHNNLIDRTYKLEQSQALQTEQIKVINHRIADIEKKE